MKVQKLKAVKKTDPVLGYSDTSTVKVDFDDMPFKKVKYFCMKALKWFRHDHLGSVDLEGFIILKSSPNHYHAVFNCPVSWAKNMHIVSWIAQQSKSRKVSGFALMQCIKESSTLRLGSKGDKPCPRIVFRFGKQDNEINKYLKYRRTLKNIERKLARASEKTNTLDASSKIQDADHNVS